MGQIEQLCSREEALNRRQVLFLRSVINSYCGYLGHFKSFLLRKVAVDRHPFYRYFFFFGGFYVAGLKSVGVVMDEVVSIL